MPPKTPKTKEAKEAKTTTQPSTSLTSSNFSSIASTNYTSLSAQDSTTFSNLQSAFTKPPALPDHLAPRYQSNTSGKHMKIAYDPDTCIATDLNTGKSRTYQKTDPIAFILADEAMPGALTPAAARDHRYRDEEKHEGVLIDNQGNEHIICPAHGNVVKVEALQTDHVDSAKNILDRQRKIIAELNSNKDFAKTFITEFELDDLFVPVNNVYQGSPPAAASVSSFKVFSQAPIFSGFRYKANIISPCLGINCDTYERHPRLLINLIRRTASLSLLVNSLDNFQRLLLIVLFRA
jgi:hypothetical protein